MDYFKIFRVLIYFNEKEDFFSFVILVKYSSQRLSAVNMKKDIATSLNKFKIFPFLISNYEIHKSQQNCVWDIEHCDLEPVVDLSGVELEDILQDVNNLFKKYEYSSFEEILNLKNKSEKKADLKTKSDEKQADLKTESDEKQADLKTESDEKKDNTPSKNKGGVN